jgi:hypothetical protein
MRENNKLSRREKLMTLQHFAEFLSVTALKRKLKDEYGIDITLQALYAYSWRYKEEIQVLRNEFLKNLSAIPVSNKAYRLNLRQVMIDGLNRAVVPDTLAINKLLDSARVEMEGIKLDLSFGIENFVNISKQERINLLETENAD